MKTLLLSIIAAAGLWVVSAHLHRHFHFVYEKKNWAEAQSYCREKYTDLATLHSSEDVTLLKNMVNKEEMVYADDGYFAWIGLYDDVDSWRWSLNDTTFKDTNFRHWGTSEPNNMYSREHCGMMYRDGRWNDLRCDAQMKAVCMDVTGPNVTFEFINKTMTWTEAQSYCREQHTDLASVRDMADNQQVHAVSSGELRVWIGLFRDSWKWSDGNKSLFRNWRQDPVEPNNKHGNETCVAVNFNHSEQWEDSTCHQKRAFICHKEVESVWRQVVKVRLSRSNAAVEPNDPAVMEDILKQLQQKLKDQGLNEGVRLSWRKQPDGKVFHKEEKETKKKETPTGKDEL